MDQITVQE